MAILVKYCGGCCDVVGLILCNVACSEVSDREATAQACISVMVQEMDCLYSCAIGSGAYTSELLQISILHADYEI